MKNISVYVDFDGTITKKDIGDELFKEFGKFEPFHSQLRKGELDIIDYWYNLCNYLKVTNIDEIINYAANCEIDLYFKNFADYCKCEGIELFIVSDGFDIYIEPILKKLELSSLKIFCNKMIFNGTQSPKPFFPLANESCKCPVASCKRNAILTSSHTENIIVFVGDGYSDFCAAEHSDVIFAKKELARYCNEQRLPHYPYSGFFDVYRIFRNAVEKGKLKQRNKAVINRKKAFEQE
jgi:2-hydroxy-3-keto-5-methylthiopentenyl-1-phosphate phosphatase